MCCTVGYEIDDEDDDKFSTGTICLGTINPMLMDGSFFSLTD